MRGHADQRADRDHAGAADAGHEQIVGTIERGGSGQGKRSRATDGVDLARALLPARRAFDGDEAWAKAVEAGKILVAGREVDLALATERRLLRLDAEAVGFDRAVAAAFADEIVDIGKAPWVGHLSAFAPATLLGGAGLLIDQDGDAGNVSQLALHGVHLLARMDGHADRQVCRQELRGIVRHQRDASHAFGANAVGDGMHADGTVDRLAAGHRHGIVEQDLVGDVGPGGDRLPDRHRAGVVVGAFAEILEHVLVAGEA